MMTVREVTAMQSEGVLAAEDIHVNAQSVPIAVNFLNWALTEEKFDVFPTSKLHYLKVRKGPTLIRVLLMFQRSWKFNCS